jgi:hypothetical protein
MDTMIRVVGKTLQGAAADTLPPVKCGGVATAAVAAVDEGDIAQLSFDLSQRLRTISEGAAASGAAAAGNPVLVGAKANALAPAIDENDVANLSVDLASRLRTLPSGATADDGQDTAALNPVKIGAIVDTTPANSTDGKMVHLTTDIQRRLRVEASGLAADDAAAGAEYPLKVGGVAIDTAVDENIDLVQAADAAHLSFDLMRNVRVVATGSIRDDAAANTAAPLKIGAVADDVLTAVADGDIAHLVTDLYRRLRVIAGGEADSESLIDTTNKAIGVYYYPSEGGWDMAAGNQGNHRDLTLTGKITTGEGDTTTVGVYGTNDEDATASNRTWILLYGWRSDLNDWYNGIGCINTTVTFGWEFENINYKYVRIVVTVTNDVALALEIKARRKTV